MKKVIGVLSLLAVLFSTVGCSKDEPKTDEQMINIITVNDLHGVIYEEDSHKSLAHLKAEINKIENEDNVKNTLVIANGDMFQGTAISNLSHGETVINVMNEVGFDVLGIGNHEFDWGIDEILKYFDGNKENGESTAKLVNSNIYKGNELLKNSVPYSVFDLGFIKVGVVSYAPHQLKESILKTQTEGYDFRSVETMESVINDCKKEADVVVANMHYGKAAGDPYNVKLMNYGADAIVNGHEHKKYCDVLLRKDAVGVPVVQNRDQLKQTFGHIRLTIRDKKVVYSEVSNKSFGTTEDKDVLTSIENEYAKYKDVLEEKLCVATGSHYKNEYAIWASKLIQASQGVDCGIINSGGIRNVKINNGDTITYSDAFNIMPFDNKIYIFELNGYELINISGIKHFKGGISEGNIDQSKTYKVAIIDYVARKYSQLNKMIEDGVAVEADYILRDLIVNEMRAHGKNNIKFNPENEILTVKK